MSSFTDQALCAFIALAALGCSAGAASAAPLLPAHPGPQAAPQVSVGIRWNLSDALMESLNEPAPGRTGSMAAVCLEDGGVRRDLLVRQAVPTLSTVAAAGAGAPAQETVAMTEWPDGRVVAQRSRPASMHRLLDAAAAGEVRDRRGELAALYPQVFLIDCAPAGRSSPLADSVRQLLKLELGDWAAAAATVPPSVDLQAYGLGRATLRVEREGGQPLLVLEWRDASGQPPPVKLARLQEASEQLGGRLSGHARQDRFTTQHHEGELSESASYQLDGGSASLQWSFGGDRAILRLSWSPAPAGAAAEARAQ